MTWGALKVDIAKAYDRIDWNFLKALLIRMGFPQRFIDCIMDCVSSASFNLLLNGNVSTEVEVRRGLRQGDPLSPYLFILCMNVLSCLVSDAEGRKECQGIKLARRGPSITHLLYADDLILFFRADNNSPLILKGILHDFCTRAGLSINVRSPIWFSVPILLE